MLAEATQQIATDALEALAVEDPWLAVVAFFETTAARQDADRSLYQALAGQGRASDKIRIWPQIVDSVTRLLDRAERAGVIRDDFAPEDAVAVLAMLGALHDGTGRAPQWRRYLALILDGARAVDRPALPGGVTRFESLDEVIAVAKRRGR